MRRRFVIVLFLGIITGCSSKSPEQIQAMEATRAAELVLTLAHGDEVLQIIENHWLNTGSLDVQKEPNRLSQFMTGPMLDLMLPFGTRESNDRTYYVTSSAEIREIHVLEYSALRIKAIACGTLYTDEVTFDGEYIESLQPLTIRQIFVFVREDQSWKLFTGYDFGDPKAARRDWAYVSDETKEAIGDLETYIDMYWGCGLNLRN